MNILLPKHDVKVALSSDEHAFFYLIGPVLGGGDWQRIMCQRLALAIGDCTIAVPCRWGTQHTLAPHFVGTYGVYECQTDWEDRYIELALAVKCGGVICWLGEESLVNPRNDGEPYGRDTYGEMGYLRGLLKYNRGLPIIVGASPHFHGLSTIRRNYHNTLGYAFPFYETMEEVVEVVKKRLDS